MQISSSHVITFEQFCFPSCSQDLATQIFFWDKYKRECRAKGVKRNGTCRFVPPALAEWMSGSLALLLYFNIICRPLSFLTV